MTNHRVIAAALLVGSAERANRVPLTIHHEQARQLVRVGGMALAGARAQLRDPQATLVDDRLLLDRAELGLRRPVHGDHVRGGVAEREQDKDHDTDHREQLTARTNRRHAG